jgi:hypothetical protein
MDCCGALAVVGFGREGGIGGNSIGRREYVRAIGNLKANVVYSTHA